MAQSIQHIKTKVRAPRVHITYDVETDGGIKMISLPFVLGVVAALSGDRHKEQDPAKKLKPFEEREFKDVSTVNFDAVLKEAAPTLRFDVEYKCQMGRNSKLSVALEFQSMKDFEPAVIVQRIEPGRQLIELRHKMRSLLTRLEGQSVVGELLQQVIRSFSRAEQSDRDSETTSTAAAEIGIQATQPQSSGPVVLTEMQQKDLDAVIQSMRINDEKEQAAAHSEIDGLISKVLDRQIKLEEPLEYALGNYIAEIDALISDLVSAILHHEKFQRLEATWRGIYYLVRNTQITKDIKIRILNVTRDELDKDLKSAKAADRSLFYKKLVEDSNPYSAVICDFEFDNSNDDIEHLSRVAKVAALAHAPFIAAASAGMFDINDFTELSDRHIDFDAQFSTPKYLNWNAFRDTEESRYVGLVAPRFLVREPYHDGNYCNASFNFTEDVKGHEHSKYLWSNAAYAFGARLTDAFFNFGWTTAIIGEEGGGRVENLPLHCFTMEVGVQGIKCPTEIRISDSGWAEMSDQGFIPLVYRENTNFATFYTALSCQHPAVYDRASSANANARLSVSLPYIFAASRFAHYVKVIYRTKLGTFMARKNLEDYLNRWILNYVVDNEDASQELKTAYPLKEARIDVEEVEGQPGRYRAVAYLKPHMHIEATIAALRLVVDLPHRLV